MVWCGVVWCGSSIYPHTHPPTHPPTHSHTHTPRKSQASPVNFSAYGVDSVKRRRMKLRYGAIPVPVATCGGVYGVSVYVLLCVCVRVCAYVCVLCAFVRVCVRCVCALCACA